MILILLAQARPQSGKPYAPTDQILKHINLFCTNAPVKTIMDLSGLMVQNVYLATNEISCN